MGSADSESSLSIFFCSVLFSFFVEINPHNRVSPLLLLPLLLLIFCILLHTLDEQQQQQQKSPSLTHTSSHHHILAFFNRKHNFEKHKDTKRERERERERERDEYEILTMDCVLELQLLLLYMFVHVHGLRNRIEFGEESVRRYLGRRTELVVLDEFDRDMRCDDTVCVCD